MQQRFVKETETPLGTVRCVATQDALMGVFLEDQTMTPGAEVAGSHPIIDQAISELEEAHNHSVQTGHTH